MTTYLVRHARAGSRGRWDGPGDLRPLSTRGELQSKKIAKSLGKKDISQIISSPYKRCWQTVSRLAEKTGIELELRSELAEGSNQTEILNLLAKTASGNVVLCSHGDVIEIILAHAVELGVNLETTRAEKGSVWILEFEYGQIMQASYTAPPE